MMKRVDRLNKNQGEVVYKNQEKEEIVKGQVNKVIDDNSIEERKKGRKIFKFIIVLTILIVCLFYYMRFIETDMLFIKEVKVTSEILPSEFHGLKVVHFSDLHYKMSIDDKYVKKVVKKINDLEPDVVVFTGDLLDQSLKYNEDDLKELSADLNNIKSNYKYYIKGNHDYEYDVDSVFLNANFIDLNNTYDYIYKLSSSKIVINGLGSSIQNDFNISTSFDFDDTLYNITLLHEPDNIDLLGNYSIDLALSGHSHNGQINIPFIDSLVKVEGAKTYYKNYYLVGNTPLYINQGLGTSVYRYRLFTPPTINLYRLTSY